MATAEFIPVPEYERHGERVVPEPNLLNELAIGVELAMLHISPVYWGWGIPRGDGSAVVLIPGLGGGDFYLAELRCWLKRIGYKPYSSGIGIMADCFQVIADRLKQTVRRAFAETGRKVHLIGHSLGGLFARILATLEPDMIDSVIILGSPIRGFVAGKFVFTVGELIRKWVRATKEVPMECGTTECSCEFVKACDKKWPESVAEYAFYTPYDGLVSPEHCISRKPWVNIKVSATHIGMVVNPIVWQSIAKCLADARVEQTARS